MSEIEKILNEALRQYRHADGEQSLVFAYEKEHIDTYLKAGWRCCIDHILKPENPCPICQAEELGSRVNFLMEENRQLRSLLGRIHKATDQFYKKQAEGHCKKPDNCPYERIVIMYHELLPGLPKVQKVTEKRKAAMRQRWQNDLETLDDWFEYFKDAARKPFLFGKNDREWVADFDFLLREQTITFMQEGKYD